MNLKTITPYKYRVVVEIPSQEEVTASGIVLVKDTQEAQARQSVVGVVVSVGDEADIPAQVGEQVLISRYGGWMLKETGLTDRDLRILNDEDILAKVELEEETN